jgi:site-specific recombinase XerD
LQQLFYVLIYSYEKYEGRGGKSMPYGFINHIENKGYSYETIRSYQKVVQQFFAYLTGVYKRHVEPYEINPSDIRNYLEEQKEKEKSISTINKELAILKTLFHYLWEVNKAPLDPTVKLKRFKVEKAPRVEITYEVILSLLEKVLKNDSYSPMRKAIFLLACKGLKTTDFRFKRDDVEDFLDQDLVTIQLKNRKIELKNEEATCFMEYFFETALNDSDYVFTSKSQGEVGPIQVMTILNQLKVITNDYLPEGTPSLTLVLIRRAIAYHLYTNKMSIQQLSKELGIEEVWASNYLKKIEVSQKDLNLNS